MTFMNRIPVGLRTAWSLACAAMASIVALPADAARFDGASEVRLLHVTGDVRVTTHSGDAVEVVIRQGKAYQPIRLSFDDGVVLLRGEYWRDQEYGVWRFNDIDRTVRYQRDRGDGSTPPYDDAFFAQYPVIEISMPRAERATFIDSRLRLSMDDLDARLELDHCYVYGEAGDVEEAIVGVTTGSRLVLGNVAALLELDASGKSDVLVGDVSMVDIDIAGPSAVKLGDVDGQFDVSIAGSGIVRAARVVAPFVSRIAGSGRVIVQAGRADPMRAIIDGSGAVEFDGIANSADFRLSGSSEVRVKNVSGRLSKAGSGAVFVGGERLTD